MGKNFYKNFDESTKICIRTVGAIGIIGTIGNYWNYRHISESRETL